MSLQASWGYDFVCDRSLEQMQAAFNESGPWTWELRDSAWYGEYLNARPAPGVRVRVHEYPQMGEAGMFVGRRDEGFSAVLEIAQESAATRSEVDEIFRRLLSQVNADLTEIEPYD